MRLVVNAPAFSPPRDAGALRIQAILGPEFTVIEFVDSTHTAAEAAAAISCDPRQVAKSLIFTTRKRGRAVLAAASGGNRVDTKRITEFAGERVRAADAEFIRSHCGFEPGGVSPVGRNSKPMAILNTDLQAYPAGHGEGQQGHACLRSTAGRSGMLQAGFKTKSLSLPATMLRVGTALRSILPEIVAARSAYQRSS